MSEAVHEVGSMAVTALIYVGLCAWLVRVVLVDLGALGRWAAQRSGGRTEPEGARRNGWGAPKPRPPSVDDFAGTPSHTEAGERELIGAPGAARD